MELTTIINAIEKDYPDAHSFTKREMLKELGRIQALPEKWRKEKSDLGSQYGEYKYGLYIKLEQCADELENLGK
jgi:hypothetical protein